jgi:hypothetical protein
MRTARPYRIGWSRDPPLCCFPPKSIAWNGAHLRCGDVKPGFTGLTASKPGNPGTSGFGHVSPEGGRHSGLMVQNKLN